MSACFFLRPFQVLGWAGKGLLAISLVSTVSFAAAAQEAPTSEETEAESSSEVRRVEQGSNNEFSLAAADRLAEEASAAIAAQDYPTAIEKLTNALQLYNELSTFYQELASMFVGVDTRQNQSNRDKAIEAAQNRDQVTYQLALIYRTQNRPEEAIPLLMDILRSQQPTRDLGQQAYQQLFELGFVDAPYED
ncbi:MAG: hypothetical protein F6J95_019645 [Leptolyngbya sp. SIO1E4]|nr:hypothetical protein [Leptolyngbya sp. SIO1E4]